jgi:4-amino-4-deoxy-L-arabinose transferase-like glycosyltransferase
MRFQRGDLPGILIATLGPVGLMVLFLAAFDVWDHHGTPLLGAMSANIAIGGGLLAAFTRFIRNWDWILGAALLLGVAVVAVIILQQTDNDGTAAATAAKWVGVIAFLVLNAAVVLPILNSGLGGMLSRRDAKRAAESET